MADKGLEELLAAQRLSDAVYDVCVTQLGMAMEAADMATHSPQFMKQFSFSAGGAVLRFQDKAVMHHNQGAPIKTYLEVNRMDFLLPPKTQDGVKALDIPPDILAKAQAGNLTARASVFKMVHGTKSKSEEAASLATVEALIANKTNEPGDVDLIADDATRRARRAADTSHANNPWSAAAWSITNQGKLVKSIGVEAAAGIAASVGSHIGATKPSKVPA